MNKVFYLIALQIVIWNTSLAQTEKGRWQAGAQVGNFRFEGFGQYQTKQFSANLTPTVGYFVANNVLVGTGVPINYTSATRESPTFKYTTTSLGVSPFIRYYFGQSPLKPYAGAAYSYSRSIIHNKLPTTNELTSKGFVSNLAPSAGVAYFINSNVALTAGLSFNFQHVEQEYIDPVSQTVPGSSVSDTKYLALELGFQLFFGK